MSVQKIVITKQSTNYTILPNHVIQNLNDMFALGLWTYLSSLSESWTFYKSFLQKHCNVGRDKLDKVLSKLKDCNLIKIDYVRDEKGKFSTMNLQVLNGESFIEPGGNCSNSNPVTENPLTENQLLDNSTYKYNIKKNYIYIKENKDLSEKKSNELVCIQETGLTTQPELPDWLPETEWDEFVQHRKSIKAPLSKIATGKLINKLRELRSHGENIVEILNNSIMYGWKGIFSTRQKGNGNGSKGPTHSEITARLFEQAMESRQHPTESEELSGLVE